MKKYILLLITLFTAIYSYADEKRVALIVGNNKYSGDFESLRGIPYNDMAIMNEKLGKLGFKTHVIKDVSRKELLDSIDAFWNEYISADVGVFYFSGHGTSIDQSDLIVPCEKGVNKERLILNSLPIKWIGQKWKSKCKNAFVFFDACRNEETSEDSLFKGLVTPEPPIISDSVSKRHTVSFLYATPKGKKANIGSSISPFTKSLSDHLWDGDTFSEIVKDIKEEVEQVTGKSPHNDLGCGDFSFNPNGRYVPTHIHVDFEIYPNTAIIELNNENFAQNRSFKLKKGKKYSYTISAEGYEDKTGVLMVDSNTPSHFTLTLSKIPSLVTNNDTLSNTAKTYDNIIRVQSGLACIRRNNKFGYVDIAGSVIIPFMYDDANAFKEGLASVQKDEKWGFIDENGNVIIPFMYDDANAFKEGLASVQKGNKFGIIDKNGKVIIPFKYDYIDECFYDGLALARKKNKYGYIDKNGKVIIPFIYDGLSLFHEGLVPAQKDEKWGFIDKNGNVIIPFMYDEAYAFKEGLASVQKDEKRGFIDKSGNIIVPFIYNHTFDFKEGLASVQKDEKWGFIDKSGNIIVPFIYDWTGNFYDGLTLARKENKYGYIDKNGKVIIPFIYDDAGNFHDGLAPVRKKGKYGYIDKNGNVIIPFLYDYYWWEHQIYYRKHFISVIVVKKDGKWGGIDKKGNIIIPFWYNDMLELLARMEQWAPLP